MQRVVKASDNALPLRGDLLQPKQIDANHCEAKGATDEEVAAPGRIRDCPGYPQAGTSAEWHVIQMEKLKQSTPQQDKSNRKASSCTLWELLWSGMISQK